RTPTNEPEEFSKSRFPPSQKFSGTATSSFTALLRGWSLRRYPGGPDGSICAALPDARAAAVEQERSAGRGRVDEVVVLAERERRHLLEQLALPDIDRAAVALQSERAVFDRDTKRGHPRALVRGLCDALELRSEARVPREQVLDAEER